MFSLDIIDTDAFLDMPLSTQALYFHLAMRADDDGFVSNPKKIMKMLGAQEDDFKILLIKRFILTFSSGICVIKHWLIHNLIRSDRYTETQWKKEKSQLLIDPEIKKYSLNKEENSGNQSATSRQPVGNQSATQVRLGKVRLGKVRLEEIPSTTDTFKSKIKKNNKEEVTLKEFCEYLKKSPNRHIRLIGDYAQAITPNLKTGGQWYVFMRRHMRAATELAEFDDKQIEASAKEIWGAEWIHKWTIETLVKFLT